MEGGGPRAEGEGRDLTWHVHPSSGFTLIFRAACMEGGRGV